MDWTILIILLVSGLFLIAVEILFVPGVTVFGVLGNLLLIAGIIYAFLYLPTAYALLVMFGSFLFVAAFTIWFFKYGIKKRLALKERESKKSGFKPYRLNYEQFLGKNGVAISPLRPVGKIEIENEILSAVSEGDFIEQNREVTVVKVEGNKVVVKEKPSERRT